MKDYIDRIALLSFLRREANEARIYADENGGESIVYAECLEDVIVDIERIPAADVEPVRHSHWEWMNTNKYTQILTCSTCGGTENVNEYSKFCPNCGAKMDGGNADETD